MTENGKLKNSVAPASQQEQSRTKGTVLVVGDFKLMRVSLKQSLKPAGYTVIEAENCSQALDVLKARGIDLVIMDIKIADTDGLEMVQRIRFNAQTANMPVIICTASTAVSHLFQVGIQGLLIKPIRPQAVLTLVNKILNPTNGESLQVFGFTDF